MELTSIHIYGHLLSDDIIHSVERDFNLLGNREIDFRIDVSVSQSIDYAWSSLRNDWNYYKERSSANDPYGTRRSRDFMERLLGSVGYKLDKQNTYTNINGNNLDITYFCENLNGFPVIVVGDKTGDANIDTLDKSSLDFRAKGERRRKSPHATMLEYLNNTDCVYGIVANGRTIRLIRNSGQLVKLTYIEFDIQRMLEEDKYTEFCLMFRLLHASRFFTDGDEQCIMERYFNMSIESGNRIRAGLSDAVKRAMEFLGNAAIQNHGSGNDILRNALSSGVTTAAILNKELIHFIYRVLFLFIIEDRNLVYQIPDDSSHPDYARLCRQQEIYKQFYAASRLRSLSENHYLRNSKFHDIWEGLMDTFRLFEANGFGDKLGIKPLGGMLFGNDTLHYIKNCRINNEQLLNAFAALNEFSDEKGQLVKINYSSLDVEEFGSVYEGILEMRPFINHIGENSGWEFGYVGGLDRQSTSSYYTRPDLVQNLIRTTLEPVIKERIKKYDTPEEKVKSLLQMKVCDAASGSGHIVLAMARTIAWYVCSIRTGEENPASLDYREALREVIQKCVYAVDYNPDAVELCKVVLWIEGYCAGRPLSFLDHHIRCGNSVVGLTDLETLLNGVPSEAFAVADKDNKKALKMMRDLNKNALDEVEKSRSKNPKAHQNTLFTDDFVITNINSEQISLADQVREITAMPEDTLEEEVTKKQRWVELMSSPRVKCLRRACNIYSYAFYHQFEEDEVVCQADENGNYDIQPIPYTKTIYHALEEINAIEQGNPNFKPLPDEFKQEIADVAARYRFFHWCVEFPEVFADGGGFDVMCGNPPWDKIKVEDKKWFESHGRSDIVNAGTAAQRKKAIAELPFTDPELHKEYVIAQQDAEAMSRFVRFSGRFPLTATGDIDLYPMFSELCLTFSKEAWGLVLPTGIAINDSTKIFFSKLIEENRLVSLYSFENEEKIFQGVAHNFKFCLLTAGKSSQNTRLVTGGFYLRRLDHILDPNRIYQFKTSDFVLLNPNTKTCPVFRTSRDAELTAKIYHKTTVLINDNTKENPWKIKFGSQLHMSSDSYLFRTYSQLIESGAELDGNKFNLDGELYVPLYEGKMIWLYNHHFGTWPTEGDRPKAISSPSIEELSNVNSSIMPWYWVPQSAVDERLIKTDSKGNTLWEWKHKWLIGFRDVTNATNERTFVCATIPDTSGVGNSTTLLYQECGTMPGVLLLGCISSITFDYVAKQKIGGSHASITFVKQFPILTPEQIPSEWTMPIVSRVAQLQYFNHDLDGWAEELYEELSEDQRSLLPQLGNKEPFIFDDERRAVLQAELDAIFAHLYGLNTEDLRYILDPEDVCGKGCINQTFRVLKDNEIRRYGEYRTRRLVLEAWNKFGFNL